MPRENRGAQVAPVVEPRAEDLKILITLGKKRGYVTYEEMNTYIPENVTTPEQVESILNLLDGMDIEVTDSAEEAGSRRAGAAASETSGNCRENCQSTLRKVAFARGYGESWVMH